MSFCNKNVLITAVFCVMFSLKDTFEIKKRIPHFSHSKILVLDIFCRFLLHSEHECHTHIIEQLKKRVCSNWSGPLGPRRTSYLLQAKQTKVKLYIYIYRIYWPLIQSEYLACALPVVYTLLFICINLLTIKMNLPLFFMLVCIYMLHNHLGL